jgi:hypothetical protein
MVKGRGVPRGDAQDARVSPPTPPVHPPRHVHPPPPQPERLVMRKDEAVGNKKKMQVCLPKHNYKLDNNLLTVEPRAVDPHCFDAEPEPDPAQNLDADPDPDPGGAGQPTMCIPPGKILGTPLVNGKNFWKPNSQFNRKHAVHTGICNILNQK